MMTDQIGGLMKRYRVVRFLSKAFFAAALIPVLSLGACNPSSADIETALKNYLEKNPQYLDKKIDDILKKKNLTAQAPRPPEPSIDELMKNPVAVDITGSPVEGNASAPITVVTFSDFQCPFCARVVPTMKQLLKDYHAKVKYVSLFPPIPF